VLLFCLYLTLKIMMLNGQPELGWREQRLLVQQGLLSQPRMNLIFQRDKTHESYKVKTTLCSHQTNEGSSYKEGKGVFSPFSCRLIVLIKGAIAFHCKNSAGESGASVRRSFGFSSFLVFSGSGRSRYRGPQPPFTSSFGAGSVVLPVGKAMGKT